MRAVLANLQATAFRKFKMTHKLGFLKMKIAELSSVPSSTGALFDSTFLASGGERLGSED